MGVNCVDKKIVALVGGVASGKTTVGRIFAGKGFEVFECSDVLRDWLAENGFSNPTRDDYSDAANNLRRKYGCDYFTRKTMAKVEERWVETGECSVLLSGMRRPESVHYLRENFAEKVLVVGVEATIDQRIQRIRMRMRASDFADLDAIKNDMEREWFNPDDEFGNRLRDLMPLCDFKIDASVPLGDMIVNVKRLIDYRLLAVAQS